MLKQILIASLVALASTQVQAAFTITVVSQSNPAFGRYLQPDGVTPVNGSYEIAFGVLDRAAFDNLTPQQKLDFSVVSGLLSYNANQTFTFDSNGLIFQGRDYGSGAQPLAGNPTPSQGDDLYTLVYNTIDTAIFGLFGGIDLWQVPTDLGSELLIPSELNPGDALVGSLSGSNAVLANTVPEPSTYALVAGMLTLGLVAYRRRQRA